MFKKDSNDWYLFKDTGKDSKSSNNKRKILIEKELKKFKWSIKVGGVVGIILFSLLVWFLPPKSGKDGQDFMIFMITSPIGWIIGSIVGGAIIKKKDNKIWLAFIIFGGLGSIFFGPFIMAIVEALFL